MHQQNFHRFQFIEVSPGPEPHCLAQRLQANFAVDIPPDQFLNYLDLVGMRPVPNALKALSKRLLNKYRFIPIIAQPSNLPLRIPGHFDPQYHLYWEVPGITHTLYIALCPQPYAGHVLRLIYNATGWQVYALPMTENTFERFMAEQFHKILSSS